MSNIDSRKLLKDLCLAFGPSGYEEETAEMIRSCSKDVCDSVKTDRMGGVIATVKGGGEGYDPESPMKIMISAHMDEVGFMITEIDGEGYLKFGCVGGIDARVLCGKHVTILGESGDFNGKVHGIITSKAIHHQTAEERRQTTPADKMYIDIGASSKEDAEKYVTVGCYGTFDSEYTVFGKDGKYMKSKATDDRLGCAVMIDVMSRLQKNNVKLPFDLYCAFTVREELGRSGAQVAAQTIAPDFAIVLETTAIADIADVNENSRVADVGNGGVISLMDRSTIYDREFVDFTMDIARRNEIKAQIKRYVSGGNDAGHIHKSGKGVRCLAISAPTRYLHSSACVISFDDYDAICDLVYAILTNFTLER